jgi:hypothetical protein
MDGSADALGVVPAHTYARLRFDEAAEQAVQHLGYVLQMHQGSPYQGQFVAQSEQRAGASPRSFPGPDGRENPRGLPGDEHSRVGMRRFGRTNHPPVGPFASIVSPESLVSPSEAFANVPSGSPALRARHARAISPGSRARADRPLSPLIRDRPFHHFAGMGCSPPHIALLSGLQGTGMTGRQITDVLNRLAMQFGPVQGRLLPRCKCVPALLDEFRASRDREENVRRCWFFRASPRDFFFFAPRIRRTRPPRSPLSTLSDLVHLSVPVSCLSLS